jgi:hypothetical protein
VIYFVQDLSDKLIKIGFSSGQLKDRLCSYRTRGPVRLVGLMPGDVCVEKAWHKRFSKFKQIKKGKWQFEHEWFKPVSPLIEAIYASAFTTPQDIMANVQALIAPYDESEYLVTQIALGIAHTWVDTVAAAACTDRHGVIMLALNRLAESLGVETFPGSAQPTVKFSEIVISGVERQRMLEWKY